MVLGAYYYGFFVSMLPGGFLAERYGGRWVLLFSILGGSLISLIQPLAANEGGATFFILSRAIQGAVMVNYGVILKCAVGANTEPTMLQHPRTTN
jgi:MFS family permease